MYLHIYTNLLGLTQFSEELPDYDVYLFSFYLLIYFSTFPSTA